MYMSKLKRGNIRPQRLNHQRTADALRVAAPEVPGSGSLVRDFVSYNTMINGHALVGQPGPSGGGSADDDAAFKKEKQDLDELKACTELGFTPEVDPLLSHTLPALGRYYAVNKSYNDAISKPSTSSPSVVSDCDSTPSPIGSPHAVVDPCHDGAPEPGTSGAATLKAAAVVGGVAAVLY
ncbi:hypothetical protein Goarm_011351 [Gossypium armourianum]|uniref:Uncharacterized protein n=1 Tax=Gossypium armourianum TaxID=34283 RepID=A0A7J9IWJ8_9ROSI|nr:hypothetical protein [Gossypium armourianum]